MNTRLNFVCFTTYFTLNFPLQLYSPDLSKYFSFWSNQYPQSLICRCFSSPFAYFSYTSIGGMNDSSNSVPVVRFMRNNL